MSAEPYISVIVPAYQAEDTIAGCLEAIYAQKDFSDYEVILADDHSTDRTAEIARGFPVRYFCNETNKGAGATRNLGAKQALGQILFFVDSDVYLEPSTLAAAARLFRDSPDTDAAVGTYTELPAVDDDISVYHNFLTFYHHDLSMDEIEWFWGAMGAIRKETFNKMGGFTEHYRGAAIEDLELGYALALAGHKIAYRRDMRGAHARRFDIRKMLNNDYRKAGLGVKLYLTEKQPGRHAHGYSNIGNAINLIVICVLILSLLTAFMAGWGFEIAAVLILLLFIINWKFYRFIQKIKGASFLLRAVPLHWITLSAMSAGCIAGLLRLAFSRCPGKK